MKTVENILTGLAGSSVGFLSLFGLQYFLAVRTKTGTEPLAALIGCFFFGYWYFMIIWIGHTYGQKWLNKLKMCFFYGVFGGMLGMVMASLAITTSSELSREAVATTLCGLLLTLLFLHANRHIAFVTLVVVIALVFVIVGVQGNLFSIILSTLISVGAWLISPLILKMPDGSKKINP